MTSVAHESWFQDEALKRVLLVLNEGEGEARVVGGAVRNSLMGIAVSDMDIATTLRPEAVQARAEAAGLKCVPTGIKHGTVTLVVDGRPFEVTTLRRDVETNGRHAEVEFTDDWKTDAERRDLTINALYADQDGKVHDYVGGLADIETATIRFIGSAQERIAEDYLRILRFFRFFAHYGKGRPDAEGLRASAGAKSHLKSLSAERVWSETKKLLCANSAHRALLWMRTSGVLSTVIPETEKWGIDAIPGLEAAETKFGWKADPLLRLVAMVPPDGERLAVMYERLKMSGQERKFFDDFAKCPVIPFDMDQATFRQLLYRNGVQGPVARLKLAVALSVSKGEDDLEAIRQTGYLIALINLANTWKIPQLPLKGSDLMERGYDAGPNLGAALAKAEKDWIESDFALSKEELIAAL